MHCVQMETRRVVIKHQRIPDYYESRAYADQNAVYNVLRFAGHVLAPEFVAGEHHYRFRHQGNVLKSC